MRWASFAAAGLAVAGCGGILSAFGEDPAPDDPGADAAADIMTAEGGGGGDSSEPDGASGADAGDADAFARVLRVFVTKGVFSGSALQAPDARCQLAANDAQLGGLWRAWLSHPLRQANQVIVGNGPWQTLGGTVVAVDRAQLLSGTLAHAIDIDDRGGDAGGKFVWTGTSPQGDDLQFHCEQWNATVGVQGSFGRSSETDGKWTEYGTTICTNTFGLYCFEQP